MHPASLVSPVWADSAREPVSVGQPDGVCSEQMLVLAMLINASCWRNCSTGKAFEEDLPRGNLLACSLCESCEAATR